MCEYHSGPNRAVAQETGGRGLNKRSNWIRIGLWQGIVDEKLIDFDLLLN